MSGRRGWSVGVLLLAAAVIGAVVGTTAGRGSFSDDPEVPVADVERAAARTSPLGSPSDVRAGGGRDPMVPSEALLAGFPPFPGAKPRAMGASAYVMGMPLELAWFSTKASAEEVLRFYEQEFDKTDLFWVSQVHGPNVGSVGYLEREDDDPDAGLGAGVLRLVSVVGREGGGESLVFLSRARPQVALGGVRGVPAGVVLPEGAEPPAVVEVNEEGSRRATITSRVERAQVGAVAKALEARQQGEGWAVSDVAGDERRMTWTARKGGATTTTALRQEGGAVEVLVSHQLRAAPLQP